MMDLKNIKYVFVLNDIARQATTILDNSSATYIADGEMVVADAAGNVITTTAASYQKDKMKLFFRKGDAIISTPTMDYKNVKRYKVTPYAAATQQVTYLGYNGTTGDLEAGTLVAANDYIVTVRRLDTINGYTDSYYHNKSAQWYNGSATSGQYRLADGLIDALVSNFNDQFEIDNFVIFERVCSNAGAAIAGTGNVTVVNGSKTISAATDIDAVMSVGDYIRIGGTGVTSPVYKIASMNTVANTAQLDVPYQGTSATVLEANCEYITAALAANVATNWGIKMTGNEKTFEAGKFNYDVVAFDITLTNFDDTDITTITLPYKGLGTYAEVAQAEWEAFGAVALPHMVYDRPPRVRDLYAEVGNTYDWLVLGASDTSHTSIHSTPESLFEVLIAIPTGSTQGDSAGSASVSPGVATALDLWLTDRTGKTYNEDANLT